MVWRILKAHIQSNTQSCAWSWTSVKRRGLQTVKEFVFVSHEKIFSVSFIILRFPASIFLIQVCCVPEFSFIFTSLKIQTFLGSQPFWYILKIILATAILSGAAFYFAILFIFGNGEQYLTSSIWEIAENSRSCKLTIPLQLHSMLIHPRVQFCFFFHCTYAIWCVNDIKGQ